MAVYFCVFNRQRTSGPVVPNQEWESAKLLPASTSAPVSSGGLESARVVKLEAGSVAEAQKAVGHFFPGEMSDTPIICTEAQFKES